MRDCSDFIFRASLLAASFLCGPRTPADGDRKNIWSEERYVRGLANACRYMWASALSLSLSAPHRLYDDHACLPAVLTPVFRVTALDILTMFLCDLMTTKRTACCQYIYIRMCCVGTGRLNGLNSRNLYTHM